MFLLVILLPLAAHSSVGGQQLNDTQVVSEPTPEVTEAIVNETSRWQVDTEKAAAAVGVVSQPPPRTRGPRLSRRRPRRGGRFRGGSGPRLRDQPPYNVYNPYYRVPQTYYDAYYNPYQGYYPEYAQPNYYPPYPYQPQQPYPQPYPYPPPPPVVPTPPPTLAPIPDLYYVQNTDGHYQYRRVSVTRRSSDSFLDNQQYGHYNSHDRRPGRDYKYPRRPGRPPAPSEFRPPLRLTSAPYQAQVFGVTSPPRSTLPTESPGG